MEETDVTPIVIGEQQAKLNGPRCQPDRLLAFPLGNIDMGGSAQFTLDEIGGKACADEAVIERPSLSETDSTAKPGEMTLETCPNKLCLVRFGEDRVESGIDMVVRDASGAQIARDTEASLSAPMSMAAGVFDRVAGIIEVVLFAQPRDDRRNVRFRFGTALQILPHLLNRMRAAREGPQRRVVKLLLG